MLRITWLLFLLTMLTGCNKFKAWVAGEFMADKVSDGVARLSAQHMSMMLSELNPRFDDAEVNIIPDTDKALLGKGTVTWTLRDLDIIHANETVVHADCNGEEGLWQGKLHVKKATRTMYGRLTGNAEKPVIPDPGQVKIKVDAEADHLSVRFPSKEGHLKLKKGALSFSAYPRLAQNESGMRLAPTPNTRFHHVVLSNIQGTLVNKDVKVPVEISHAKLEIQVGVGEDGEENQLKGTLMLSRYTHEVPSDNRGLDPNYERERFISSYACKQSTPGQVSFQHVAVENKIAPAMAALTSALMAVLATEIDEDSVCGINSPEVYKSAIITGEPGQIGALDSHVNTCVLDFTHHQTSANCFGQAKIISGTVKVINAHKKINGIVVATPKDYLASVKDYTRALAKNPLEAVAKRPKAVLPSSRQPATMSFTVKLDDVVFKDICTSEGDTKHPLHCQNKIIPPRDQIIFGVENGEVEIEITPLAAKSMAENSPTQYFCATKTPVGEATLKIKNLTANIDRGGMKMRGAAHGEIALVRGFLHGRENELSGHLFIGPQRFDFKSAQQDFISLDPTYDREIFLESFMSCKNLELARKDSECRPEPGLAANIARLLVLNAGSLLKVAACSEIPQSFASKYALDNSKISADNTRISMPALISQSLDLEHKAYENLRSSRDGLDTQTTLSGHIRTLEGLMTREGIRLNMPHDIGGINVNIFSHKWFEGISTKVKNKKELIIRPISPSSTRIKLFAEVEDFKTLRYNAQQKNPEPSLMINQGMVSIVAQPYFALDKRTVTEEQPSYSIATPVVKFEHIRVEEAHLVFKGAHLTIPMYCEDASLKAHNGRYKNEGNYIEGRIKFKIANASNAVSEDLVRVAIKHQALVPDYNQDDFDKSYAKTDYLERVLSAE